MRATCHRGSIVKRAIAYSNGWRLAPPFAMNHFAKWLALLLALANRRDRIAKGQDRQDIDLLRYAQRCVHMLEIIEANPV